MGNVGTKADTGMGRYVCDGFGGGGGGRTRYISGNGDVFGLGRNDYESAVSWSSYLNQGHHSSNPVLLCRILNNYILSVRLFWFSELYE